MNILLACILLVNLIFLAGFALVCIKLMHIYRDILDFIMPPNKNTPSKLANVCEAFSEMMGRSLVASLKAFLMGKKSGEVRQENAETGAEIDAGPLGAIVGALPKSIRSSLIKNPQLVDLALNFMSKRNAGKAGSVAGNNHTDAAQVKFNL